MQKTLFSKLWNQHEVLKQGSGMSLLYIDRIFLHERTGSVSLKELELKGRKIKNPEQVFCTMDHIVDTLPGRDDNTIMPSGRDFIVSTRDAANKAGINLFDIGNDKQGIVHVISAEQGITLPGLTQVCPDSHTCTLGALGALAWGIGSSEGEHALATKTLSVKRPKLMRVRFEGKLNQGVTSKDMILYLIGKYSASGGVGHAIEFSGDTINALEQESRFTLCNMAVEFGCFTGLIAPDQKTFDFVYDRPFAPKERDFENALVFWKKLYSDDDAVYDKEIFVKSNDINPQVSWGTSPGHVIDINGFIPNPDEISDLSLRSSCLKAIDYMDLKPGQRMDSISIDAAFIGSCTNSRISDLRDVAKLVKGRKVSSGIKAIIVPGSTQIKHQSESEGLDIIFKEAGFEWRESGCSMCFYVGGESFKNGSRVVSSTNRNFENRQGPGIKTHLASPITVAASAIKGKITDVRKI
ncbi:MAG: 3-isopropylmalate dehydratase large subunit [Alphaproteobacteria bacterium TMED87]|nr:3-isopropylmalate dehydratase large subunit [Rhodospirillaceae bacterium]OUV10209.1 MAG: 3-isopropylmalate dehydratase large subunit [Alphaproteobacteria bacterium TMED87]